MDKVLKFRTPYVNRGPRVLHCPFPHEVKDYILDTTKNVLVECGTIPFYERIQSFHDTCKLSYKLRQYSLGDTSALGIPGGSYGDFTSVPGNLQEVLQYQDNSRRNFENLPPDIRAIFDGSYESFRKAVTDGSAEQKINEYFSTISRSITKSSEGNSGTGGKE